MLFPFLNLERIIAIIEIALKIITVRIKVAELLNKYKDPYPKSANS